MSSQDLMWDELKGLRKEIKKCTEEIHLLRNEITRYKGFVSGIAVAFGMIGTAIGVIISWAKGHI